MISDTTKVKGLEYVGTNGVRMNLNTQEPTTQTEADSTYNCGNATVNTGAPQDAVSGTGMQVVVPAISGGSVTATATAADWSLTNGTSEMYGSGDLSATKSVTNGDTFDLDSTSLTIRD